MPNPCLPLRQQTAPRGGVWLLPSQVTPLAVRASTAALLLGTVGAVVACGGAEPSLGHNSAEGDGKSPSATAVAATGAADGSAEPSAQGEPTAAAPGIERLDYPNPPYGTREGATIANLEFFGWSSPTEANFDLELAQTISLADFYDPDGAKGIEYVVLNAVAVWCGVCRSEYENIKTDAVYQNFSARGVEMLGVLFEDNNGGPATYNDLVNWSARYEVAFPFVTDPGLKTGVYFDRDATPMNMIIDAKTMQIAFVMTGYNPLMYDQLDRMLAARGR